MVASKSSDPARTPTSAYAPVTSRNVLVALLVGLVVGIGIVVLREQFDDAIKSTEDLAQASNGLPMLGVVPADKNWQTVGETHLASVEAPTSAMAESFRTLRTSLQFARIDDPARILQVTSAKAGEGKSTTSANLGVTLSRAGQKVLLIDLDLRRPRQHLFFGLPNSTGFTTLLLDPDSRADTIAVSERIPGSACSPLAQGRATRRNSSTAPGPVRSLWIWPTTTTWCCWTARPFWG